MNTQSIVPEYVGEITLENYCLKYSVAGKKSKKMIVIGGHLYYPKTFSLELLEHFTIYFVDHIGFSKVTSDISDFCYFEMKSLLKDLELFRNLLNIEDFILVGHSGHGYIALEYAKKYPKYVSHLLMIAISPNLSAHAHQKSEEYFQNQAQEQRKESFKISMGYLESDISKNPEKRFISMMLRMAPRIWFDYKIDRNYLWDDIQVYMPAMDYIWGTVFREIDITFDLDNFNVKTLLVLGKNDYLLPDPQVWDEYLPKFKDIDIKIINDCGHNPQLEQVQEFNQIILSWFWGLLTLNNP